jgi:site-specific recombinase XerD
MQRRTGRPPLWETQVHQTIQDIKSRSKSRSLKSVDLPECICIYIGDHLNKQIFSYQTIANYYRHLSLFRAWLKQTQHSLNIRTIDASCIRNYFFFLEETKHYKKFSLQVVQIVLRRFFRSAKLRRLIRSNPVGEFHIQAKYKDTLEPIPSPFELMRLLRSVKEHYQYLLDHRKAHKFSLFIHRRDLGIFALCASCGLRRAEIQRIQLRAVDFDQKTIRVAGKGCGRFTIRERLAFFSHPFLEEILKRYWQVRKHLPGTALFCNWLGDELTAKSIDSIFQTYNDFLRNGMHYNPTVLRKSFCTHLVQKKVNLTAIQQLLGHEKCETTLTYYVRLSEEQLQRTWKETNPYGTLR